MSLHKQCKNFVNSMPPFCRIHPSYSLTARSVSSTCVCACTRAQLCLPLCDSMECSPPSSSVEFFQARILEWVSISSPRASSRPRDRTCISCVSCIGRWILYHCATWEKMQVFSLFMNIVNFFFGKREQKFVVTLYLRLDSIDSLTQDVLLIRDNFI